MATYWIDRKDFENKVAGKTGLGESVEVLLMDAADKQWIKAEVRPIAEPKEGGAVLKVLADFGEPTDEEFYIEVLNTSSPEED